MFALLEHDIRTDRTAPAGPGDVHWDLVVEVPGEPLLPTWRLATNPISGDFPIPAERIADHPPRFLDYEGPLRRAPGAVRRVDRGAVTAVVGDDGGAILELNGEHLRGAFMITQGSTGGLLLRPR